MEGKCPGSKRWFGSPRNLQAEERDWLLARLSGQAAKRPRTTAVPEEELAILSHEQLLACYGVGPGEMHRFMSAPVNQDQRRHHSLVNIAEPGEIENFLHFQEKM